MSDWPGNCATVSPKKGEQEDGKHFALKLCLEKKKKKRETESFTVVSR